jgi:hypothetical protein
MLKSSKGFETTRKARGDATAGLPVTRSSFVSFSQFQDTSFSKQITILGLAHSATVPATDAGTAPERLSVACCSPFIPKPDKK